MERAEQLPEPSSGDVGAPIGVRATELGCDFEREVFCLMGLPIDAIDLDAAVRKVRHAALSNTRCFVSTPNLNFLIAARSDPAFRDSIVHSDLSLADGMPLLWMARLLGIPLPERVSGADLFERLLHHDGPPITAYFFGGPSGTAEEACRRVDGLVGGIQCVGYESPGFGSVEELSSDASIDRINRSGAQFVIVSLGAKKGQAWIERNRGRLLAPVLCHLGAVVKFAAGSVRRAPLWVQRTGAEWLWRIKEEPILWRRYFEDGVKLVGLMAMQIVPSAMSSEWAALCGNGHPAASMTLIETPRATAIEIAGSWTRSELPPLRHALSRARESHRKVAINLRAVSRVDASFLGLILMASGALAVPRLLEIRGATPRIARTFKRHGVAFLLSTEP
jgi:N-acetylglucosaminyldiphosphoundecaprenol N-acetyl-beta-D-mannosaminyltransferase